MSVALLSCAVMPLYGQDAGNDREKDAVRRVVETYLFTEEVEEKKRTLHPEAKIFDVDSSGRQINVGTVSKLKARSKKKGEKELRSPQKVVSIDVYSNAASVKVATDFTPEEKSPDARLVHYQYLSLLKVNGEWKIVGILMPTPTPWPRPADK